MGFLKRLISKFWKKEDLVFLYDGKARAVCERCGCDIVLRVGEDGEILNMRFLGMDYTCEECGNRIGLWEEGERIWVGGKR